MPLVPNGDNIEVTNENKMRYLNVLAEYRLCTRIKEETEAFLEGNYLCITLRGRIKGKSRDTNLMYP